MQKDGQFAVSQALTMNHLIRAIKKKNPNRACEIISELKEMNADFEHRDADNYYKGCTALHLASHSGYANVVKALIEAGAQVEAKVANGTTTALHIAAQWQRADCVRALIEIGKADMDAREKIVK
jgi:ankyrin repeat protein